MKTLKITLISVLVAFSLISMANNGNAAHKTEYKKIKNVTIEQALKISGLEAAMYRQIDPDDLMISPSHIYVATVSFEGTTFLISGTLDQWVRFFKREGLPQINKQRPATLI